MRLTRIRFRSIGAHGRTAPPLPAGAAEVVIEHTPAQCRAKAASTGKRCKMPAGPSGYCGVFHRPPAGPAAA
jgi:hypothetical protein